ncbi:MAG: hypothetical protein V1753_09335 [Pseudomonadota bacterium]
MDRAFCKAIKFYTIFLSLICFIITGCTHREYIAPTILPKAEAAIRLIQKNNGGITSIRAKGKLTIIDNNKTEIYRAIWIARLPNLLRLDLLSPWGQPFGAFAMDEKNISFFLYQRNQLYAGKATPENLARIIHISFMPADILKLLRGSVPISSYKGAQLEKSSDNTQTILTLFKSNGDILERIWYHENPLRIKRADYYDGQDSLTQCIAFDNFSEDTEFTIPYSIHIKGASDTQWDLIVRECQVNPLIPMTSFTITETDETEVIELD